MSLDGVVRTARLIEELLFNTQHGIVDQSLHSRMGAETTNGDGFGIGWYGAVTTPRRLPQRHARLGGRQPARARGAHRVAAVPRARARGDRLAGAGDQLPPVPPRPLAVRPQRLHRRLPARPARPDARRRPGAVRGRPRIHGHRGAVPSRAHLRARGRPDRRARAADRLHRGDRRAARGRAPFQGSFGVSDGETLWARALRLRGPAAHRCSRPPTSTPSTACIPRTRASSGSGRRPADRLRAVLGPPGRLARDPPVHRGDGAPRRRAGAAAVPPGRVPAAAGAGPRSALDG